jgi:2-keto-4-pentenoate hydratase
VIVAEQRAAAAVLLSAAWAEGRTLPRLPDGCVPADLADGWAIQRELDAHVGPVVGWKIAATSSAGQASIGADGPHVGRLYDRCLAESPARVDATTMTMRVAEAEFAFRFGADLRANGPAVDRTAVLGAVAALVPAIEVPDSRFDDFLVAGLPCMVADALCAGVLVLGDEQTTWSPTTLRDHAVTMRSDGAVIAQGRGADVLGDPVDALTWAVRWLHNQGEDVRDGEIVTTGACTPPRPIVDGAIFVADFGTLGEVAVAFAPTESG